MPSAAWSLFASLMLTVSFGHCPPGGYYSGLLLRAELPCHAFFDCMLAPYNTILKIRLYECTTARKAPTMKPPIMRHRLLHGLVFSSSVLLEACASTHRVLDDAALNDAALSDSAQLADAIHLDAHDASTSAPDAGADAQFDALMRDTSPDAAPDTATIDGSRDSAMVDAHADASADAWLTDARLCEPGWPTTKGSFEVTVDEQLWGCTWAARNTENEDVDLSFCCLVQP